MIVTTALACVTSLCITPVAQAAPATDGADKTAEAIDSVAPSFDVANDGISRGEETIYGEATQVATPEDLEDGISIDTDSAEFGLALPQFEDNNGAELADAGTIVYSGETDIAVQVGTDESVRVSTIVENDSTREFDYQFSDNITLYQNIDGSVSVYVDSGEDLLPVGTVEAPWARDATGTDVATSFAVAGNVLTQTVHVPTNASFPVVADPWFIPILGVAFRVTAHAASRMAARNISQAAVKAAIQYGRRTPGNQKGTSVYTHGNVRVVVNDRTNAIITVTKR